MIRYLRAAALACGVSRRDADEMTLEELIDVGRHALLARPARVATPAAWGLDVPPDSILALMVGDGDDEGGGGGGGAGSGCVFRR